MLYGGTESTGGLDKRHTRLINQCFGISVDVEAGHHVVALNLDGDFLSGGDSVVEGIEIAVAFKTELTLYGVCQIELGVFGGEQCGAFLFGGAFNALRRVQ